MPNTFKPGAGWVGGYSPELPSEGDLHGASAEFAAKLVLKKPVAAKAAGYDEELKKHG
jgi:hypothetical protein